MGGRAGGRARVRNQCLAPPLVSNYGQLLMGGARMLWALLVHSISIDLRLVPQLEKSNEMVGYVCTYQGAVVLSLIW